MLEEPTGDVLEEGTSVYMYKGTMKMKIMIAVETYAHTQTNTHSQHTHIRIPDLLILCVSHFDELLLNLRVTHKIPQQYIVK